MEIRILLAASENTTEQVLQYPIEGLGTGAVRCALMARTYV